MSGLEGYEPYIPVHHLNQTELPLKCQQVITKFKQNYHNTLPDFISRSPGRVNLIGEHIDYTDFAVLPMAIDVDVLCAIKILNDSNPSITLINDNPNFAQRKFDLPIDGSMVTIDPSVSEWSNYFKCALRVAHDYLNKLHVKKHKLPALCGLQVFIQGNVPTGGGLSSSAAFTCSTAIAIIRSNMGPNFRILKQDLTEITTVAEHYLGVNNGGMDQAASIFGQKDHALYVEFKPRLRVTPLSFPSVNENIIFIIANSLVVSNKFETGPTNYNLRVIEMATAANVLAHKYSVSITPISKQFPQDKPPIQTNPKKRKFPDESSLSNSEEEEKEEEEEEEEEVEGLRKGNLRDFMDAYTDRYLDQRDYKDIDVGIQILTKMLELVEDCFAEKKDGYTIDDISEALNCSREEYTKNFLTVYPVRFQVLKLYQRAKHVYSEALRVLQAVKLGSNTTGNFFHDFGALMNQSQESCDKLYECSCPEINDICRIARNNGSHGSRLTGAGWGGCTVHLVSNAKEVDSVKTALIEQFYKKRYPGISESGLASAIIISKPANGGCIYEL